MRNSESEVCILMGGGIDSACLLPYYAGRRTKILALHFDYGQPSFEGESLAITKLCQYYDVDLIQKQIGFNLVRTGDMVHARNAFLIMAAAGIIPPSVGCISLGLHYGTSYFDSSSEFIDMMARVLDGYFAGAVELDVPLINLSKDEVFELASSFLLPFELTFSCDRASKNPCDQCLSCADTRRLHEHSRALQEA